MAQGSSTRKPLVDLDKNGVSQRTRSANSAFTSSSSRTGDQNLASESKQGKGSSSSGDQSSIASKPPTTRAKATANVERYASTKRGNCDDDGSTRRKEEHPLNNVALAISCIEQGEDPTHFIKSLGAFPYIQKALWSLQWDTKEGAGDARFEERLKKVYQEVEEVRAGFIHMEVLEGSAVNSRNDGKEEEDSSDDERCGGGQKSFVANRGKKKDEINLVGEPPRSPKKKSNKSTDDSIIDNVTQKCTAKSTPPVSSTEVSSTSMRSYPYKHEITLINPDGSVKTRTVTIKCQSHDPIFAEPDENWVESVVLALLAKGGDEAMNCACAFLYWIGRDLVKVLQQRMLKGHKIELKDYPALVGLSGPKDFAYYLCSLLLPHQSAHMLLLALLQGDHLNPKTALFLHYDPGSNGERARSHHTNFEPLNRDLNEIKSNHIVIGNMYPVSVKGHIMSVDEFNSPGEETQSEQFDYWVRVDDEEDRDSEEESFDNEEDRDSEEESFDDEEDRDSEATCEAVPRTRAAVLADLKKSKKKLKALEEKMKEVRRKARGFYDELRLIDQNADDLLVDFAEILSPGYGLSSFASAANRDKYEKIEAEFNLEMDNMTKQDSIRYYCKCVDKLMSTAGFTDEGMQSIVEEYGPKVLEIKQKNATASNASGSGEGSSLHDDCLEKEYPWDSSGIDGWSCSLVDGWQGRHVGNEAQDSTSGCVVITYLVLEHFFTNGIFPSEDKLIKIMDKYAPPILKQIRGSQPGRIDQYRRISIFEVINIRDTEGFSMKGQCYGNIMDQSHRQAFYQACLEQLNQPRAQTVGVAFYFRGHTISMCKCGDGGWHVFESLPRLSSGTKSLVMKLESDKLMDTFLRRYANFELGNETHPDYPTDAEGMQEDQRTFEAIIFTADDIGLDDTATEEKEEEEEGGDEEEEEEEEIIPEQAENSRKGGVATAERKAIEAFENENDVFVLNCRTPGCCFLTVGKTGNKTKRSCKDHGRHIRWQVVSRKLESINEIRVAFESLGEGCSVVEVMEKLDSNDDSSVNNMSVEVEEEERVRESYSASAIGTIRSHAIKAFDAKQNVYVLNCGKNRRGCHIWNVGSTEGKKKKKCPACGCAHLQWKTRSMSRALTKRGIEMACERLKDDNCSFEQVQEELLSKKDDYLKDDEEEDEEE